MSIRSLFARLFGRKPVGINIPFTRHAVLDPARSRCFWCEAALDDINLMNRTAQRAIMMLAADNRAGAVAVIDEALNAPSRLSSVATVSLALAGLSVQAKPPSPSPQEPPQTCE